MGLPTREQMFLDAVEQLTTARRAIGDARDELNSTWTPIGSALPDAAADARVYVKRNVAQLEAEIDVMKNHLYAGVDAIHAEAGR